MALWGETFIIVLHFLQVFQSGHAMHRVARLLLLDFLGGLERRLPELLPFSISKELDRVQHVGVAHTLGAEEVQQHLAHDPHAELLNRISFELFAELEYIVHALFDASFDLRRKICCRGERVVPKLEEGKVAHQLGAYFLY
jgi:hypothetical protein